MRLFIRTLLTIIVFLLLFPARVHAAGIFLTASPSDKVHTGNPDNALVAIGTLCKSVEEVPTMTFYVTSELPAISDLPLGDTVGILLPGSGLIDTITHTDDIYSIDTIKQLGTAITVPRDIEGNAFLPIGSATNFPTSFKHSVSVGVYHAIAQCGDIISNIQSITLADAQNGPIVEAAAQRARDKRLRKEPLVARDYLITDNAYASVMAIRCTHDLITTDASKFPIIVFQWDQAGDFTSKNKSRTVQMVAINGADEPQGTPRIYEAKTDIYFAPGRNYIWYTCFSGNLNRTIQPVTVLAHDAAAVKGIIPMPPLPPCAEGIASDGAKTTNPNAIVQCTSFATGLGNFSTDAKGFVEKLFAVLLSLSGGIAILLIIRSGYQLMLSQGNPEAVKVAKEGLTSAIVGFLFLIFSLVILEVIGVDILQIPGLSR